MNRAQFPFGLRYRSPANQPFDTSGRTACIGSCGGPLMNHLVIMAAGTGGHVMPGLAVAQEMRSRGWTVSWLGTPQGMENRLVPPTGIVMDTSTFPACVARVWATRCEAR